MSMVNLEQARQNMVEHQVRPWDVLDPKILQTFDELPRDAFVPDTYKGLAYADTAIPLGNNQYMMHPVVEGRMLQALEIQPDDRILEIGTGSGYITACLAKLGSHVDSIEIETSLSQSAAGKLAKQNIDNVTLIVGDAMTDISDSQQYDVICVTGSMATVSDQLKQQLKLGGRMFVITGEAPVMYAHLITRTDETSWSDQCMFETSLKALIHAEKAAQFDF
jgi:protein-L-isoaspartate(D-aspartate) O-methyltransferase